MALGFVCFVVSDVFWLWLFEPKNPKAVVVFVVFWFLGSGLGLLFLCFVCVFACLGFAFC